MPMNALLFLIRVNAVYHHSRLAMMIFILTWLPTCTTIMSPWSIVGSNIGPTSYCIISSTTKHAGFIFLIFTLFDTVIFVAVTLHILSMSSLPSRGSWFKTCISGKGLGKLSKALLYTGQLYYLSVLKLLGFVYHGKCLTPFSGQQLGLILQLWSFTFAPLAHHRSAKCWR